MNDEEEKKDKGEEGKDPFQETVTLRDYITKDQEREIRKFYNQWAREIRELEKSLPKTPDTLDERRKLAELYYQLRSASIQLSTEINSSITSHVEWMGRVVERVNAKWLESLGFTKESINRKFSQITDTAIRNILTGNVYAKGGSLSDRVWKLTNSNLNDMNTIIAKGLAEGKSLNEIAKELTKYVNPDAKLGWQYVKYIDKNGNLVYNRLRNNQVDYNARRLAKTMIQHAYQQALVSLTKDNPFVNGYIWHADGKRPCALCEDRDNQFFTAEELPLDHPNGECSMEPSLDYKLIEDSIKGGEFTWEAYDEMLDFFMGLDFRNGFN